MSDRPIKRKRKSKNRRNQETVGLVKIFEERSLGTGKWAWRTTCRRKECPPELVFKTHSSYEEALSFAKRLDDDLKLTRKQDHDPALLVKLRDFEKKWRNNQLAKLVDHKGEHDISSPATTELALDEILDVGSAFWEALREVNKFRVSAGSSPYSADWAARDWVDHQRKVNQPQERIRFADAIDEFIAYKSGDTGSKYKKRKLGGGLTEWKTIIQNYLTDWVGDKKITDPKTSKILVEKISKGKKENGDLWSDNYRKRIASKIKGFGIWLHKEKQLTNNPFENLPGEFEGEDQEIVSYFSPKEVRTILETALEADGGRMLDYYVFLLFSTLRPYEIAHHKISTLRLKYNTFEGWKFRHSNPDGYEWVYKKFQTVAGETVQRSKTKDRAPVLLDIGADWLKFKYGNLPVEGQVGWWKKTEDKIHQKLKDETGQAWFRNGARHTLLSYARRYPSFRGIQSYWAWVAGHDLETFRKHYSAPVTEEDSVEFFSIAPPRPMQATQPISEAK